VPSLWNHYQVKATLHLTAGTAEVKLNGVTVLLLSGVQTSTVTENIGGFGYGSTGVGGNTVNIDDLYAADDFLGDLIVKSLFPTSDGDSSQWTPSTGTNHSANVDETSVSMTDFNSDSVSGHRDLYQVTDLSGVVGAVYGIREGIYLSKSDSGDVTVKPVIKENSVVTVETAQGMTTTADGIWGLQRTVKPSDSAAWSQTDVNNLQIGMEVA
jgi:hypothetical protein